MRRLFTAISAALVFSCAAMAQTNTAVQVVDSVVVRQVDAVDVSLDGKSVFSLLSKDGSNVTISQDASIPSAMAGHVNANRSKSLNGFRVRIFFDNKQNSRGESEAALKRFQGAFPGVPAYRSFTNPFFKVTVGDFRTKSEATQLLNSLKGLFPNAFVVKEAINYPAVDKSNAYVIDTVKVSRPVQAVTL